MTQEELREWFVAEQIKLYDTLVKNLVKPLQKENKKLRDALEEIITNIFTIK